MLVLEMVQIYFVIYDCWMILLLLLSFSFLLLFPIIWLYFSTTLKFGLAHNKIQSNSDSHRCLQRTLNGLGSTLKMCVNVSKLRKNTTVFVFQDSNFVYKTHQSCGCFSYNDIGNLYLIPQSVWRRWPGQPVDISRTNRPNNMYYSPK